MDNEAFEERVAIRQYCGGMSEKEAIRLTNAELPKEEPESVRKAKELHAKVRGRCLRPKGYLL